ncbi:transcriptional regulator, SARP family [Deinococcus aerius]|uniref:Transcriptional regulator, SARP family n=1 Tax=Deinococcus aerius TaxID=200253 RepID=A0A2I9D1C4_9DEIO|nr:transcriptional regulator, SARP family [Deinococcus aerius]
MRTLGGLSVGEAVYRREKPLLLLAYLCLEGAQPRRRLASLFWPEASNPMNSLAQHLIRLRPLGGVVLDDGARVEARLECDVDLFRAHGRAGRHAEALGVYGGPFLDGLGVALGPDLEEWLFETREALGREARSAHLTLAERRLALGDLTEAAAGAERAYVVPGAPPPDPADLPRLHRLLQPAGHPLAETVRREADELEVPLTAAPSPVTAPPLLGRMAERAALEALGPGQVAWVSGPAGTGKSALLAALTAQGGWRVLPGRPGLPLATLEPLAPRLAGTADALAALSDSRLRVALDGWEDADEATRAALTLAARQRPGAALVIAARDPPALPIDLHLTLGPLTPAELAAHPGAFEATAGHPSLLAAFLRGAPPDQTLDAHLNALPPPAREVYLTLALQAAPNLAATRAALRLPAADFARTLDLLAREGLCTPGGEVRTPGTVRELLNVQPAHAALRHLHLARAHPEGRGWPHWQAARALWEEEDHPAAARAAHAYASEEMKRGYPGQAAATLEGAPQTGEVRLLRAWALLQLGEALRAGEVVADLPTLAGVTACRAVAAYQLGRYDQALALAEQLPGDGSLDAAHGAMVRGHVALRENRQREAQGQYRRAAALYRLNGTTPLALTAENLLASMAVQQGAEPWATFAPLLEASQPYPPQRAVILSNLADCLSPAETTDPVLFHQAEQLYQEAAALYELLGNRSGQARVLNARGVNFHVHGDHQRARELYEQALRLLSGGGNLRLMGLVLSNLSEVEGNLTQFDDALNLLERAGHLGLVQTIRSNARLTQVSEPILVLPPAMEGKGHHG